MNITSSFENKYLLVVSVLFLALFSNIRYQTGFAIIRIFDVLTILSIIYISGIEKKKIYNEIGLLCIIPFFFLHVVLSLNISFNNFIRESIQIIIIVSFLSIILKIRNKINYEKLIKNLFKVFISILFFVIAWHLNKGIVAGWKSFADSRIVYSLITILFFVYFKIYYKDNSVKFFLLSFILLIVLIFSGERKAIAIFIFLFSLNFFKGIGIKSLIVLFIIYFSFSISLNQISNPYIKDKISTTLNLMNTGNFNYVLQTGNISEGDTWSNAQRSFSIEFSKELFLNNPFFGVGTNNYINIVQDRYSYLPEPMKEGIHGEFQRVLIENGIFGLIFYLLVWIISWRRFKTELKESIKLKLISNEQLKYLTYSIYLPIIFYVGTEASSTRSFILLGLISILPDIIKSINNNKIYKKT